MTNATQAGQIQLVAERRFGTVSPLRYPGGKAALAGLFSDIIHLLGLTAPTYIEPYAGGAGAGIALLRQGLVGRLVINDIDPAVYAFWCAVTEHNDAFVTWVHHVPLTVDEWEHQRHRYRTRSGNHLELARAFFYLNRTNRSGVIHAGVIGGRHQTGTYQLDARFNRQTLADRLTAIGDVADAIEVSDLDGRTVIRKHRRSRSVFLYIDPPYVRAGAQLYLNSFSTRDHHALAATINTLKAPWILTYDPAPIIQQLYRRHFQAELAVNYSGHHPGRARELLVASRQVAQALTVTP